MPVCNPREFIQSRASQSAKLAHMRFDDGTQVVWEIKRKAVFEPWVTSIEIHAGTIGCNLVSTVQCLISGVGHSNCILTLPYWNFFTG
jgi:hypothetical protein